MERTSDEELGHCNETKNVGGEHALDDGFIDVSDLVAADNIAGVVDCRYR